MTDIATYRNDRPYGFCPGCSHRLILEALDRALVRLQWDPAGVVIVTDIGCVGLSDQYFVTSGFHGLHGRSLTYASGIKLTHPELHVINLIGDGGCGIGLTHVVNAARRNFDITTLVFNNLNFGMTGGEHSVTTPRDQRTSTTPWGSTETPLNLAQTVAINGASFVWRGTAFDRDLDQRIEEALVHEGFALLDIWELCVAYFAKINKVNPKQLKAMIDDLGFQQGMIRRTARPEGVGVLQEAWAARVGEALDLANPLDLRFSSDLGREFAIVIAGAAGGHVRTAGRLLTTAATMSGLWTTQRDDYPVTVGYGHSLSEVVLAPTPIRYAGIHRPDVLFVLSEEGYEKVVPYLEVVPEDGLVFVLPSLTGRLRYVGELRARLYTLNLDALKGVPRAGTNLAVVAAGLARLGFLSPEALLDAAARVSPAYATSNRQAVQASLDVVDDLIVPLAA
ncbi:MAG: thiamine pyrophosphate-dependent enzyme [Anaerolineae bacterium]